MNTIIYMLIPLLGPGQDVICANGLLVTKPQFLKKLIKKSNSKQVLVMILNFQMIKRDRNDTVGEFVIVILLCKKSSGK